MVGRMGCEGREAGTLPKLLEEILGASTLRLPGLCTQRRSFMAWDRSHHQWDCAPWMAVAAHSSQLLPVYRQSWVWPGIPTDRDCHEVKVGLFLGHLWPPLIAVTLYKREDWTVLGVHHSCPHRPCHLLLPSCVKKQVLDRGLCPQSFSTWVVLARKLGPAMVVLTSLYLWH